MRNTAVIPHGATCFNTICHKCPNKFIATHTPPISHAPSLSYDLSFLVVVFFPSGQSVLPFRHAHRSAVLSLSPEAHALKKEREREKVFHWKLACKHMQGNGPGSRVEQTDSSMTAVPPWGEGAVNTRVTGGRVTCNFEEQVEEIDESPKRSSSKRRRAKQVPNAGLEKPTVARDASSC